MQLGANLAASPVRGLRPPEVGSPAAAAAAHQPASTARRLVLQQQPSTPTRLFRVHNNVPPSPAPHQQAAPDRTVAAPASLYTSRQGGSADQGAARRNDEEEHSASQLILLLTLSVVLLTLPWVVDHPVTLLVPVALLILPFTSGALRSMVYEGFTLVSAGFRWFWRHRNATPAVQRQPAAHAAYHGTNMAWHPPVMQHPPVHSADRSFSVQQLSCTMDRRPAPQPLPLGMNAAPNSEVQVARCKRLAPTMHLRPVTQNAVMGAFPPAGAALAPAACQLTGSAADLTTPDLDFDSDGEGSKAHVFFTGPSGQEHQAYQNAMPRQRTVDEAAECTVYNWDVADECAQRRGHRSLSELLSNGQ